MTNRIDEVFAGLGGDSDAAARLICFATAGYPDLATCGKLLNQLPGWGADLVEIGMPFSDASADGGAIRAASKVALERGTNTEQVLQLAASFRAANPATPLILMGYYNPILHYGGEKFAAAAVAAGVDGLIIVDLPPEEEWELTRYLGDDLYLIHLITPTTDAARLGIIAKTAKGFLYYVSVTGTTGSAAPDLAQVAEHLAQLKPPLPVAIGFGISAPGQVRDFSKLGQGVVVGSAIIKTISEAADLPQLEQRLAEQLGGYKRALTG